MCEFVPANFTRMYTPRFYSCLSEASGTTLFHLRSLPYERRIPLFLSVGITCEKGVLTVNLNYESKLPFD